MTPERWRQITAIFHAGLDRDAADREAFVAASCGDDAELRHEVASMFAAHADVGGLAETPASPLARRLNTESDTSRVVLVRGTRFGPYEVVSLLGMGGMGAVYRARDTRLQRDVALKVLLAGAAGDPDRVARFAQEARVLASLNHTNIAQIHGVEESAGVQALIMELVDGLTLADRIERGALPLLETLDIAKQLAEALEAAHEHGVIHRDLKPANVKVRADGTVKVLDFGLAKLVGAVTPNSIGGSSSVSSAVSAPTETAVGTILGSIAYMPPEQAKGNPVDRRADLWAFGCVLFEMLTGRRAFAGETLSDVVVNILEHEPGWHTLPVKTPAPLRKLLQRCLVKNPRRRLDSAAVASFEIAEATAMLAADSMGRETLTADVPSVAWGRRLPFAALAMLAGALVAVSAYIWFVRSSEGPGPVPRLRNALQVTSSLDVESYPTWSPDGMRLAYQAGEGRYGYAGNHDIWVAQLGGGEPVNLTKGSLANDRMPSWSRDGREIAFLSDRDGDWALYTVAAIGGKARNILRLPGISHDNRSAPQWSGDGTKLLVSVNQAGKNVVIVVNLQSLETTRIALPDHDGNLCWDWSVSPDGRRFAYVEGSGTEVNRLWTLPAFGGQPVPLTDGRTKVWSPTWSRDGSKVFYVSNRVGSMDLWQQAIAHDGTPVGEPLAITQGLGIRSATFSPDGAKLAYSRGGSVSNVWRVPILTDRPATWPDAKQLTSEYAFIEFADASPDGALLAVSSDRRGNQDLWLLPTAGGEMTPLTTDPAPDWYPRWSPDGSEIAFYSYRSGNRDIWVMPSRGGPARQLTTHPSMDTNPRWSPDGREIMFFSIRNEGTGTWIVDAKGGQPKFLTTSGDGVDWSPDGQWFVLGRQDGLYRVARGGGEPMLLRATGEQPFSPRFSRDGQSIYYGVITGPRENHDIWKLSVDEGKISRLTKLEGRRGVLGAVFAADADYLYLTWSEDDGDIWVMDVAADIGGDIADK